MIDENSYWWGVEIGLRTAAVILEREAISSSDAAYAMREIRKYADKVVAHREREKVVTRPSIEGE
jgi:hypothetical protein